MSILERIDKIIEEIKSLPKEEDYIAHQDELAPVQEAVLKTLQDYGTKASKIVNDDQMLDTLKTDIDAKLAKYTFSG